MESGGKRCLESGPFKKTVVATKVETKKYVLCEDKRRAAGLMLIVQGQELERLCGDGFQRILKARPVGLSLVSVNTFPDNTVKRGF